MVPSGADHYLGFQQVEVERTTFSYEADGSQKANLWVRVDRPGLIFFAAMRAPF